MERTIGTLLGGRVRYAQPRDGYRTGIEPVLMAAAVPAQPGETVLEAGIGSGAGLLCLTARVPGLRGLGIEIDPEMAALSRDNFRDNAAPVAVTTGAVELAPGLGPVDHAFANPPWHDPGSTAPAGRLRQLAKQRTAGVAAWVNPLTAAMTRAGTLTLALPAQMVAEAMAALLQAGLMRITLVPFWPKTGQPARLVLLQARRGPRGSGIGAGLVLHEPGGGFTAAADAILRAGAALPL